MISDRIYGSIRIAAVYVVGWIIGLVLAKTGIDLNQYGPDMEHAMEFLFGLIYYVIVRLASIKWKWMEWGLIIPRSPIYVPPEHEALAKRNTKNLK